MTHIKITNLGQHSVQITNFNKTTFDLQPNAADEFPIGPNQSLEIIKLSGFSNNLLQIENQTPFRLTGHTETIYPGDKAQLEINLWKFIRAVTK
ncbi:hypothetical protein [Methylomonas sp. AM2-LC]|uniref:hypothetical protein n=1 Tax=Methylomonas sp. AM2-LC TaxID=3153301 RepID=UPI003267BFD4